MIRNPTRCRRTCCDCFSALGRMVLPALAATVGSLAAQGAEKQAIADKTLVAWIAPANLSQRGGSVLTLEKPGGTFDAIVFASSPPPGGWPAATASVARSNLRIAPCQRPLWQGACPGRDRLQGQADHHLS